MTDMIAILICPEHRPAAGVFQRMKPLALMPVLGRSLLDYALSRLKKDGFKEVKLLVSDRPETVREAVGEGEVWGLKVEVISTRHELAPDVAELHCCDGNDGAARPLVMVLDTMPGMPEASLWKTDATTFDSLRSALHVPELATGLTMQELSPGVWISTKARVSPAARLTGPLWIGAHASVGSNASIGPDAIVENGAFIDGGAVVKEAWIGPATYVGGTAAVKQSCAWGSGLLNWRKSSFLEVRDRFLLNDISKRTASQRRATLPERLLALLLLTATLPMALAAMLRTFVKGADTFNEQRVVLPPMLRVDAFSPTTDLLSLRAATGLFRRWPQLWLVVRGDLALVGNRPLSPEDAATLLGPFARLWIETPAGVFSLADAEEADGDSISEAQAHAAYFSASRSLSLRMSILRRCLWRFVAPFKFTSSMKLATAVQSQ